MFYQVLPEAVFQPVEGGSWFRKRPGPQDIPFRGPLHPVFFPDGARQHASCNGLRGFWNQRQRMCPAMNCQKKENIDTPVLAKLDFHEFSPAEIKVKVLGNSIVVHGRHQDESSSFIEVRRSVPLPTELSSADIVCRYVDGYVIVELPPKSGRSEVQDKRVHEEKHKKEECEISEEERKNYEAFMKNLTHLQQMFFGFPSFGQCEKNETVEKKNEEKKGANTDTTSKNDDDDQKTEGEVITEKGGGDDDITKAVADDKCEKAEDEIMSEELADEESETFVNINDFIISRESSGLEEPQTNEGSSKTDVHSAPIVHTLPDFKMDLDLSKFEPDDIRVVVSNRQVMVSGEREVKGDNFSDVEKFSRRINLPEGVDESKLSSVVDKDGKMTIQAPYNTDQGYTAQRIHVELAD